MRKYLFLVSLTYSFPILRPLQKAIKARGDEVAWFFDEPGPEKYLKEDEKHLKTITEVMEYNPVAVFTAGNHMYDFFPGYKVQLFHGFNINKRPGKGDHFALKGWFDLYCTQGETSTTEFKRLERKYDYFRVVETGWPKIDDFYNEDGTMDDRSGNNPPVILYSSTFTDWITSTPYLYDEIKRLVQERDWQWYITFHPKMKEETVEKYKQLEQYGNVVFYDSDNNVELLKKADVMVCDSSSIIVEFLTFGKPVVTFKNTAPGAYLIDIDDPALLESSICTALEKPAELIKNIHKYIERMNPYYDGKSSERVLAAVDALQSGKIKKPGRKKPLNLFRKYKSRKKLGYKGPYFFKKII